MKVQRIQIIHNANGISENPKESWTVLGDDHLPIKPARKFLKYLENAGKSPNTVRSYAYHLLLFYLFLKYLDLDWLRIKFEHLTQFIAWLQFPPPSSSPHVVNIRQGDEPSHSSRSINAIVAAVVAFYEYHERLETVESPVTYEWRPPSRNPKYKPFLYHTRKGAPEKRSLLKIKVAQKTPPVLTNEQVAKLIDACRHRRDRFLICLLMETGMRIGQALGLRHSDIHSFDNFIVIVPRDDNVNHMRAKTDEEYRVHVSPELMKLYADYLIEELGDIDSDYVFVNIWGTPIGRPMSYNGVKDLFNRLRRITGVPVHPHIFRHTHATDLLSNGVDASHVQKRLGHKSILTTLNIYAHVSQESLKVAYQDYLERRREREKSRLEKSKRRIKDDKKS